LAGFIIKLTWRTCFYTRMNLQAYCITDTSTESDLPI